MGQFITRSRGGENQTKTQSAQQTSNMWTLYFEILVFLNFVSPTVIPDYRKISERTVTEKTIDEENSRSLTRKKRDAYFDNILEEPIVEDTPVWSREVCEKVTRRSLLSSSVDAGARESWCWGPGTLPHQPTSIISTRIAVSSLVRSAWWAGSM